MIYRVDNKDREKLAPLFKNINSTILKSYLQGYMGIGWVDDINNPKTAQIIVGIFVFYGGDFESQAAEEMLFNIPEHILAIVGDEGWKTKIESLHKGSIDKFSRFEFEKNKERFQCERLKEFVSKLPEGYELKRIDEKIAGEESLHQVSEDFTAQFESPKDFVDRGIGFCILKDGRVVSGASSFSIYDDGIEIEVGTHPQHQRKGLATIVSSALILHCLESGVYPNWDGANQESVKLAEKLGYVMKRSYDTYYINCTGD